MAHLQNEIVSACTKNAQAMYDSNEPGSRDDFKVEARCDTGASTPSTDETIPSLALVEFPDSEEAAEYHMIPLETLKSDIHRCSQDLSNTIAQYRSFGKQAVDDDLHVRKKFRSTHLRLLIQRS
jgi:hypothetical protein